MSLNHFQFTDGYSSRGRVLSDFIGTEGRDYFGRLTARITPDFMLGLDVERAIIGSTATNSSRPQEERTGGAVDVSYRLLGRYSLFAQYALTRVKNRRFTPDDTGFDHVVRFELTRSFR